MTAASRAQGDSVSGRDGLPVDGRIIIAIDGPAGTGKSSVARTLAARLGLEFLDTGAMYRAVTAIALDQGLEIDDAEGISGAAMEADLHFDWNTDPPALMAFWKPIDARLRDSDVSRHVSRVAALPPVRDVLVRRQRIIGQQHPRLVTEGRDQGSVVFPDAEVKIFLDADRRVRAQRRADQLIAAGREADVDRIEADLARRDHIDSTREVAPLVCADDADRVDTSGMDFLQVVEALETLVVNRLAGKSGNAS